MTLVTRPLVAFGLFLIQCEIINELFAKNVAVSRKYKYNKLGRKFGLYYNYKMEG